MIDLHRYKLTSHKNGGQYSGPCYFTGEGSDRFTIEPYNPRGPAWFCRSCSSVCQHGFKGGNGYRYGYFNEKDRPNMNAPPTKPTPPGTISYDQAIRFAESMDQTGLAYLSSRGISPATAAKFHLGMSAGKFITIPLIYEWHGEVLCPAIKRRWLPQFQPQGQSKYSAFVGSKTKGVFNFDSLRKPGVFGIIANSLFDVMLLDQMGYLVAGPFAGEADWEVKWSGYIQWEIVLNIGDWDPEKKDSRGEIHRPGTQYMLARAVKLASAHNVKKIINAYPPDGHQDITAAWQAGVDISKWVTGLLE